MEYGLFFLLLAPIVAVIVFFVSRALRGPADKQEPPEGGGLAS